MPQSRRGRMRQREDRRRRGTTSAIARRANSAGPGGPTFAQEVSPRRGGFFGLVANLLSGGNNQPAAAEEESGELVTKRAELAEVESALEDVDVSTTQLDELEELKRRRDELLVEIAELKGARA